MNTVQHQLKSNQKKIDLSKFTPQQTKFYNFHGIQLLGSKFPIQLIPMLHKKTSQKIYDAGQYFQIFDNPDKQTYQLHALQDIPNQSQVFIIDHAISFRYPQLRGLLEKNPQLIDRLKTMTKYLGTRKQLPHVQESVQNNDQAGSLDLDGIGNLQDKQFGADTICLSVMSNQIQNQEWLINCIKNMQKLRALWISDNPIQDSQKIRDFVYNQTKIELYNRKLTKKASTWILKFLKNRKINEAQNTKNDEIYDLNLDDRDIFNINIKILQEFPNLRILSIKQTNVKSLEQLNQLIQILKLKSLRQIHVDWELENTIFQLYKTQKININPNLLVNKHNIYLNPPTQLENSLDQIHLRLFKLASSYRLANTDQLDQTSIWYINDQVGSAITHSDDPQVVTSPFLYAEDNSMNQNLIAYTLMWNIKNIYKGQVVQKDFLSGLPQQKQRSSRLAVWYQLPRIYYNQIYQGYQKKMKQLTQKSEQIQLQNPQKIQQPKVQKQLKVLTDSHLITQFLTLKDFTFTKQYDEADIVWIDQAIGQEFQKYTGKLLNQFPFQACLVMKNNLARTVQQTLGNTTFLQRTYDLQTQLPIFLGHFYHNQKYGLDNIWISKPPNMARSMDMLVSDNLDILIRNMETGPKLVQKYITQPVKRLNRKIDLRYIVLVRSINPLKIYLYKHFWIRTSNNQYSVDCRYREVYQTHFTVMNYGKKLTQVHYPEFIQQFNKDYSSIYWNKIQQRIKNLLKYTFKAAQIKHPQMHSQFSRAIYGVDIMVDEVTMEPKLLQMTFAPDCNRACKFYPSFYNDIFQCLYKDRIGENIECLF